MKTINLWKNKLGFSKGHLTPNYSETANFEEVYQIMNRCMDIFRAREIGCKK